MAHAVPSALVVDPDKDTREMYAEYFQRKHWRTLTAQDGSDALAQIIRAQPSIIVTELRLPHFDGWRLVSVLKSDKSTSAIPVVVVTADVLGGSLDRAKAAGADVVLTKPCLPDALFEAAVRAVAEGQNAETSYQGRPPVRRAYARITDFHADAPPRLSCPKCDRELRYDRSYLGGVNLHKEQWDYFTCRGGCGRFCYRRRTRKMRRVG
jgi:CheY-like chemotaxis protein